MISLSQEYIYDDLESVYVILERRKGAEKAVNAHQVIALPGPARRSIFTLAEGEMRPMSNPKLCAGSKL